MTRLNETHDSELKSWVAAANAPEGGFPIQNLPFGVFRPRGSNEPYRGGVAIGDQIVDLAAPSPLFEGDAAGAAAACSGSTLNAFMAMGSRYWSALRLALSRGLRENSPWDSHSVSKLRDCLVPQAQAEYSVGARIGDFTDFYASVHHATTVGRMFRPDNPLMPNYRWVPIAYHGRSSSIFVSGHRFPRPVGQTKAPESAAPTFGPSKRLDYELELGIFVGPGNASGSQVPLEESESHIFGLCVLNDWSARDIQAWEYQPLGPFLAKNFASTVSPWIVTLEALEPFRCPWIRDASEPQPLPYLESPDNRARGALDVELEVCLETAKARTQGLGETRLSRGNFRHAYWTAFQMLAHHASNGCNLQPGDLLGTGTQSGPDPKDVGSMLELTMGGKSPVTLPTGETRGFIDDGDTVIMRAWCARPGYPRIGFGECAATVEAPR